MGLESACQVDSGRRIVFEGACGLELGPERGVDVAVFEIGAGWGAANQIVPGEQPDYGAIAAHDVQRQPGHSLQCGLQGQGPGVDGAQGLDQVFEKGRVLLAAFPGSGLLQGLENRDCGNELFEGLPVEGESLVHMDRL
jgi:hypothetical protein